MSIASQPIAVAPTKPQPDLCAGYSSFSPRNFFHGSPMSLKTGSFQNRFYPGGSPGHSLGPIAMPDFKRGLAGSWENDAGAWIKAMTNGEASVQEDDLCRNYICCGVALPDLHALVEHFESQHVEIWQPYDANSPDDGSSAGGVTPAFDADDMEIEQEPSEPSPSPPATPSPIMHTSASAFDPIRVVSLNNSTSTSTTRMSAFFNAPHQYQSSYSSLAGANGQPSAFNRYAGYSDYSSNLPGTDPSPTYAAPVQKETATVPGRCVPPALLFSSSASPSPLNTPASSRTCSPTMPSAPAYGMQTAPPTPQPQPHTSVPAGTLPLHPSSSNSSSSSSSSTVHNPPTYRTPTSISRPSSSLTLTKPFRCPKPGCNKSYKQQNGLKYHLSHGQCNFAPRDPEVEKLSEVERDKRLRPFVCKVGNDCNRRYKNMNGLRYHYTHTGDHGAIGLEMLAQGVHPLPDVPVSSSRSSPKTHSHQSPDTSFQRLSNNYYPGQQQLAPPVVSTVPVPAPVSLVLQPLAQQQTQSQAQSPAPSPLSPFPSHALGWTTGADDKLLG